MRQLYATTSEKAGIVIAWAQQKVVKLDETRYVPIVVCNGGWRAEPWTSFDVRFYEAPDADAALYLRQLDDNAFSNGLIAEAELRAELMAAGIPFTAANKLARGGWTIDKIKRSADEELLAIRNFGKVKLAQTRAALAQ